MMATLKESRSGRCEKAFRTNLRQSIPKASLFLIFLLAFIQLSSAGGGFESYVQKQQTQFQTRINNWMPLAVTAILICVAFNALVFMAGYILDSQETKNYAKSEFLQTTASSLMIFFSVALLFTASSGTPGAPTAAAFDFMADLIGDGASSISCTAASGGRFYFWEGDSQFGSGPIAAYKCKLQEKINALDAAYEKIRKKNMVPERKLRTCIYALGIPIRCGSWNFDLHQKVEQAHMVASKIIDVSVSLHAQYALAEYINKNMLSVFLPLGLLLRVLPITRGVGGLFIAIGVGFFFVWPTFFLLSDPTFIKVSEPPKQEMQEGMCFAGFKGTAVVLQGVVMEKGAGQESELAIAEGRDLVYKMSIHTFFYPFIALVLTLIFIRAATPLLGGDMGELMRMVSRLG